MGAAARRSRRRVRSLSGKATVGASWCSETVMSSQSERYADRARCAGDGRSRHSQHAARSRPAQSAMHKFDAFKGDRGGVGAKIRSRILDWESFLYIPIHDWSVHSIEKI